MTKKCNRFNIFFSFFKFLFFLMFLVLKKMPGSQFEVMTSSTFPYYLGLGGIIISLLILVLSFVKKDNDFFNF